MSEHIHLLIGEPERGNPSKVMQAIKQGFARRLLGKLRAASDPRQSRLWNTAHDNGYVWQARFLRLRVVVQWLTRYARSVRDPSLRLKNGSAQDDNPLKNLKLHHYLTSSPF